MPLPFQTTTIPVAALALWVVLFSVKHVIGDFYLQPTWMALGKARTTGWFWPLLTHCLIHSALTTAILVMLRFPLWYLGIVDFAVHIIIDRLKGVLTGRYRLTPDDRQFWALIGIDQSLHHLTGFALALVAAAY